MQQFRPKLGKGLKSDLRGSSKDKKKNKHKSTKRFIEHKHESEKNSTRWLWWVCCTCGISAGMSPRITHCPEFSCNHLRCNNCVAGSQSGCSTAPYDYFNTYNEPWQNLEAAKAKELPQSFEVTGRQACLNFRTKEGGAKTQVLKTISKTMRGSMFTKRSNDNKKTDVLGDVNLEPSTLPIRSPYYNSKPLISSTVPDIEDSTENDIEVESEDTDSEDDPLAVEAATGFFVHTLDVLESCLSVVFAHDLGRAARLIPQVHAYVGHNRCHNIAGAVSTLSGETDRNEKPPRVTEASSSNDITPSTATSSVSQRQKRSRDADKRDEKEERRRHRKSKTLRPSPENELPVTFACHFRKKSPAKYNPWTNRRYLACICPSIPHCRLRQIKDHFRVHRLPQCNRCYEIFEATDELLTHQQQLESCQRGCPTLKEGLDESQVEKIEHILKATTEKGKSAFNKWYDIWKIIFPYDPAPTSPWNEPESQQQTPPSNVDSIIAAFERNVEVRVQQGLLELGDPDYPHYLEAVRQALEEENDPFADPTPSSEPPNQRTDGPNERRGLATEVYPTPADSEPSPHFRSRTEQSLRVPDEIQMPGHSITVVNRHVNDPGVSRPSLGSPLETSSPRANRQAESVLLESFSQGHPTITGRPFLTLSSPRSPTINNPTHQSIDLLDDLPREQTQEQLESLLDFDFSIDQSLLAHDSFNTFQDHPVISETNEIDWSDYPSNDSLNPDYIMNLLQEELRLPTAGIPFKDKGDINKGLKRPD